MVFPDTMLLGSPTAAPADVESHSKKNISNSAALSLLDQDLLSLGIFLINYNIDLRTCKYHLLYFDLSFFFFLQALMIQLWVHHRKTKEADFCPLSRYLKLDMHFLFLSYILVKFIFYFSPESQTGFASFRVLSSFSFYTFNLCKASRGFSTTPHSCSILNLLWTCLCHSTSLHRVNHSIISEVATAS